MLCLVWQVLRTAFLISGSNYGCMLCRAVRLVRRSLELERRSLEAVGFFGVRAWGEQVLKYWEGKAG
jgi:hypothetical protein